MGWSRLLNIRVVLAAIAFGALVAVAVQELSPRSNPPRSDDQHLDRIFAYVQEQMDESSIPGVGLALVNSDGSVDSQGFGKDGSGNAITADTPFWIGSNTKSFTALSIMQLAEAGKVEIEAPVQRYIPEFRVADPEASASITVRQVLNQTSGLSRADGLTPVLEEKKQTLEEAVADMRTVQLNRPVGETYEYSNLNFVVAGLIVQRVSGLPWTEYVQTHIFDPLEMGHSYTSLEDAQANGLSAVHSYWFGFPVETDAVYLQGVAPTGYLYSSAADMSHYLSMYLNGGVYNGKRLLSEGGIEQMLAGETNDSSRTLLGQDFDFRYGRGWFVGAFGTADDARWHLGNLPSFAAWMVLLPDTNQAVVVMMNSGSQFEIAGATEVFSRIPIGVVNVLRGETPPTGIGLNRFYILFDAVVLAIIALQVWSLDRVATRPISAGGTRRWFAGTAPLLWEFGVAGYLLVVLPGSMGMTWEASLTAIPDLMRVVLVVALIWVFTGMTRVIRLLGYALRSRRPSITSAAGQEPHGI